MGDSERPDYNTLLGFVRPVERLDPHVHLISPSAELDLREIAEIVRDKTAGTAEETSRTIPQK
jgi:hypothetical protein